jgi:hypothetical protein
MTLRITFYHTEFFHGTGIAKGPYKTFDVTYKTENIRRALGFASRKMGSLKRQDNNLYGKNTKIEFVK